MSAALVLCFSRRGAAAIGLSAALAAAPAGAVLEQAAPDGAAPVVLAQATAGVSQVQVPAPDLFEATGTAVWDGKRTLQGVWVAHPLATAARRVRIFNTATGAAVDGALFKRDPALIGPPVLVSSEAAQSLGMTPGEEVGLRIVALTPSQQPGAGGDAVTAGVNDAGAPAAAAEAPAASVAADMPTGSAAAPDEPATPLPADAPDEPAVTPDGLAEVPLPEEASPPGDPTPRAEPETPSVATRVPAARPQSPAAGASVILQRPEAAPGALFRSAPRADAPAPETVTPVPVLATPPAEPAATPPDAAPTPSEPSVGVPAAVPTRPVFQAAPSGETAPTPAEPAATLPEPTVGVPAAAPTRPVFQAAPSGEAAAAIGVVEPPQPAFAHVAGVAASDNAWDELTAAPDSAEAAGGAVEDLATPPEADAATASAPDSAWDELVSASVPAEALPDTADLMPAARPDKANAAPAAIPAPADEASAAMSDQANAAPAAMPVPADEAPAAIPDPAGWDSVAMPASDAAAPAREEFARAEPTGDKLARAQAASPLSLPYIQAGIFGVAENATRLIGRLEAADLPALGKPVTLSGQPATRVLAGPFGGRAERDSALRTIRGMGLTDAAPVAR